MNWKEQFDEMKQGFLAVKNGEWWASDEDYIKDFISTEIIEKLIDEIPNDAMTDMKWENGKWVQYRSYFSVKQQLRDK